MISTSNTAFFGFLVACYTAATSPTVVSDFKLPLGYESKLQEQQSPYRFVKGPRLNFTDQPFI